MAALIGVSVKPKSDGSGYVCKVPLDLLSEDGVPPQEGDSVDYSVTGTVQSVDAEDATIKIESVNGEPVDESAAAEAGEDANTDTGGPPPATPPPGSSAALRPALAAGAKKGGLGMF
jgi:hypothetical protein